MLTANMALGQAKEENTQNTSLAAAVKRVYAFTDDFSLGYYFEVVDASKIKFHDCKTQEISDIEVEKLNKTTETCDSIGGPPSKDFTAIGGSEWSYVANGSYFLVTSSDNKQNPAKVPCGQIPATVFAAAVSAKKDVLSYAVSSPTSLATVVADLNVSKDNVSVVSADQTVTDEDCKFAESFWTVPLGTVLNSAPEGALAVFSTQSQ